MSDDKETLIGSFLSPLTLPWDGDDYRIHLSSWIFYPKNYTPALFEALNIPFPTTLQDAVEKRLAEYLAGRHSAKVALNQLGIACKELKIGRNRAPVWPSRVRGSITHTDNLAVCAVMPEMNSYYLGIDLENYLTPMAAHEIQPIIIKPDEERCLRRTGLAFEKVLTLTFSIKESIFKALHPYVQEYFDFDAITIDHIDRTNRTVHMTLKKSLSQDFQQGDHIKGKYIMLENQVFTWVAR